MALYKLKALSVSFTYDLIFYNYILSGIRSSSRYYNLWLIMMWCNYYFVADVRTTPTTADFLFLPECVASWRFCFFTAWQINLTWNELTVTIIMMYEGNAVHRNDVVYAVAWIYIAICWASVARLPCFNINNIIIVIVNLSALYRIITVSTVNVCVVLSVVGILYHACLSTGRVCVVHTLQVVT